ncbi:hypothetical protein AB1Y20_002079 [Prymnesium parvum]|uniref:DUF659 domain-containing protein n=1 Tax=Prymnesium parvum TaxID=97485 RepID=A0AB34JA85_PRYPA
METAAAEARAVPVNSAMVVARLDVAAMHEKVLASFKSIINARQIKSKDIQTFFERITYPNASNKQQMHGHCVCCGMVVQSTGSYKWVTHILKCSLCPKEVRTAFQALRGASESKKGEKREAEAVAEEQAQMEKAAHRRQQLMLKQQCIRVGLQNSEAHAADIAIANFFYANAIPFSAASTESEALFRKMVSAIKSAPAGYIPPNHKKLSSSLLEECYNDMWANVRARDSDGTLAAKYGATYVSDGWDSCDSLPLINSAFITANDGGVFFRSVNTSGHTKSVEYCALLMIQDIYAFGPTNVVLIITDTCNTMAKAWALLQDEFPWVSVLLCQPHVISLLMKDVAKSKDVQQVINDESTVVGWFSNHQFPLAKLREMTRAKLGKAKELVKAGGTRFGTHTLVGERLLELKSALQATVVDPDYAAQKYKDKADSEDQIAGGRTIRTNKGATARQLILDDSGFWQNVTNHVSLTKPLLKMLRRFDTSAPAIGKLYSSWFEVGEHMKSTEAPYKAEALDRHADRWAYGHADFAAAAYVLDPEFQSHQQSSNAEVMEGFMNTVEKIGILLAVRQGDFKQAWQDRVKFLGDDPQNISKWDSYPSFFFFFFF